MNWRVLLRPICWVMGHMWVDCDDGEVITMLRDVLTVRIRTCLDCDKVVATTVARATRKAS